MARLPLHHCGSIRYVRWRTCFGPSLPRVCASARRRATRACRMSRRVLARSPRRQSIARGSSEGRVGPDARGLRGSRAFVRRRALLTGRADSARLLSLRSFISLVMPVEASNSLEVGLVGREGMLGIPLALGVDVSPLGAVVQGAGNALRMTADYFCRELERSEALRGGVNRYVFVSLRELAQQAACTRFHVVEARLARRLLMTQDRSHADTFNVTHGFLALTLGVRRVGITQGRDFSAEAQAHPVQPRKSYGDRPPRPARSFMYLLSRGPRILRPHARLAACRLFGVVGAPALRPRAATRRAAWRTPWQRRRLVRSAACRSTSPSRLFRQSRPATTNRPS